MTMDEREFESRLILNALGGGVKLAESLKSGMSAVEIVEAILELDFLGKREKLENTLKHFDPRKEIENCFENKWQITVWGEAGYPGHLENIPDPPLALYHAGSLDASDVNAAAIVGSRHPSLYGLMQTKRFSEALSAWGLTIVSGFAKGIDRQAHESAMKTSYGRTLAVLGCGLDVGYPRDHRALFEKIQAQGAVMSEYPLGTAPRAENFPKRNRIISGLSLGVFVAEAHQRSGSLITAHQAVEQGKDVFALPGQVDHLTSKGTHLLIKEGAYLVENPEDILEILKGSLQMEFSPLSPLEAPKSQEKKLPGFAETPPQIFGYEKQVVELIGRQGMSFDQLSQNDFKGESLSKLLLGLELKGVIRKQLDGSYIVV